MFRRVFERINPETLSECLYDWLGSRREEGNLIAIDGKTSRGSKSESHKAYHVVSAVATENQFVLGELAAEEKSNKITAVPELLDSLKYRKQHCNSGHYDLLEGNCEKYPGGRSGLYVIGLKAN